MKIFFFGIFLILCIFPATGEILAKTKAEIQHEKAERQTMLDRLEKGEEIKVDKEAYIFLPNVRSSRMKKPTSDPMQLLSSLGKGSPEYLEKKGPFVIYHTTPNSKSVYAVSSVSTMQTFPVVLNKRTGQFGIVTGSIAVKLTNINNADVLAKKYHLSIKYQFAHLNLVYFNLTEEQDILSTLANLQAESDVDNAKLDILDNLIVPY